MKLDDYLPTGEARRVCMACAEEFTPKHPNSRYCSLACCNKAKYAVQLTTARRLQAKANKIKMASGCVDCGYRLHPTALQFDHIPSRGKKLKAVSKCTSVRSLKSEILKCEVRCANCHFIKTMERRMMKRALTPEQERDIDAIVQRLVTFGHLKVAR